MDWLFAPLFVLGQGTLNRVGAGLLAILLVGLGWALWRRKLRRDALVWVLAMPAPWIVLALWGGLNKAPPGQYDHLAAWVTPLALIELGLTLLISGAAVAKARGARLLVMLAAALNAWFAFLAALLVAMMVTGSWM